MVPLQKILAKPLTSINKMAVCGASAASALAGTAGIQSVVQLRLPVTLAVRALEAAPHAQNVSHHRTLQITKDLWNQTIHFQRYQNILNIIENEN